MNTFRRFMNHDRTRLAKRRLHPVADLRKTAEDAADQQDRQRWFAAHDLRDAFGVRREGISLKFDQRFGGAIAGLKRLFHQRGDRRDERYVEVRMLDAQHDVRCLAQFETLDDGFGKQSANLAPVERIGRVPDRGEPQSGRAAGVADDRAMTAHAYDLAVCRLAVRDAARSGDYRHRRSLRPDDSERSRSVIAHVDGYRAG